MTTMIQSEDSDTAAAEEAFKKRQRSTRLAMFVFGLASVLRFPGVSSRLVGWESVALAVWIFAALCVFVTALRAFRCTMCGGGIGLNGKTCSSCGHVFLSR